MSKHRKPVGKKGMKEIILQKLGEILKLLTENKVGIVVEVSSVDDDCSICVDISLDWREFEEETHGQVK